MNFSFVLEPIKVGKKGQIYTARFLSEPGSEFEKFLTNEAITSLPEYHHLIAHLHAMADRSGFQKRFFREEEKPTDSVEALSRASGPIRLYCCRWTERTLILGNGGLKNVGRYQDDPHLSSCVERMSVVHRGLLNAQRDKDIMIDQNTGEIQYNEDFIFEMND